LKLPHRISALRPLYFLLHSNLRIHRKANAGTALRSIRHAWHALCKQTVKHRVNGDPEGFGQGRPSAEFPPLLRGCDAHFFESGA
jgi:hypothetical protein